MKPCSSFNAPDLDVKHSAQHYLDLRVNVIKFSLTLCSLLPSENTQRRRSARRTASPPPLRLASLALKPPRLTHCPQGEGTPPCRLIMSLPACWWDCLMKYECNKNTRPKAILKWGPELGEIRSAPLRCQLHHSHHEVNVRADTGRHEHK